MNNSWWFVLSSNNTGLTGIDIGLLINFGKRVTARQKFIPPRKNPVNPVLL